MQKPQEQMPSYLLLLLLTTTERKRCQIETLLLVIISLQVGICYVLRNHGNSVYAHASRAICTYQQETEW